MPESGSVSLNVELVISRYQGDEVVSSLPYLLSVTADTDGGSASTLRIGADVPVRTVSRPDSDTQSPDQRNLTFEYRPLGTSITCQVEPLEGDRFQLRIIINESSIFGDNQVSTDAVMARGVPVFRSYESTNGLILRDGQSRQYTAAADRVSGETVRVDVTLSVLD